MKIESGLLIKESEESGLLIKGVGKTIQNKAKK